MSFPGIEANEVKVYQELQVKLPIGLYGVKGGLWNTCADATRSR